MLEQIAWVLRAASGIEISGRSGCRETLKTRADGHGDHVLLQAFIVSDASVATRREHVHEAFLDDDFQTDIGMRLQERRDDRGQHQPCSTGGYIEFQSAGGTVTKIVDHVQRRFNLGQRRYDALHQPRPRLSGHHAAGGPVEQSHAQSGLHAPHRVTQARRRFTARSRTFTKTAGLDHGNESHHILNVCCHCLSPLSAEPYNLCRLHLIID